MRVLFVSRWLPCPPDNGSKIRIFNILRQLSSRFEVSLVSFADPAAAQDMEGRRILGTLCSRVHVLPYREYQPTSARALGGLWSREPRFLVDTFQPTLALAVSQELRQFRPDVVVASQLDMLPYALHTSGVPLVLEELEVAMHVDAARRSMRQRFTLLKLRNYLRSSLPRLEMCTVASERERELLRQLAPGYSHVRVIPNGVDCTDYAADFGAIEPDSLIFSGALTYAPNEDAMRFFLADIFPRVVAQRPGARLRITGGSPEKMAPLPPCRGVELTGYLPDVRPLVARSAAAVVPLRSGGGTRLKIIEAMALGTPVIATPKGAEGLAVTSGRNILLADSPGHFADAVVGVLCDPALREQLSVEGRKLVAQYYDWSTLGGELSNIVEGAARRRAA